MHRLETQISIHRPPEAVWAILIDFASYARWNPFIPSNEGIAAVGQTLNIVLQPPGGRAMRFRPRVLVCEPPRELRWIGRLWLPGIFDGEHQFRIEPAPGGVVFHHSESFSGLLVPFLKASLDGPTRNGFIAMNEALKREAER